MKNQSVIHRLFWFLLLLSLAFSANADVIEPFTVAQGPITKGPGEFTTPEEGLLETPSVLGGLRIVSVGIGEDGPAGSSTTLEIGNGQFACSIDFPDNTAEGTGGGCSAIYDARSRQIAFDLSGSSQFEVDVQSVEGGVTLSINLTDTNGEINFGLVQNLAPGQLIIRFDQMSNPGQNLSAIRTISLGVINQDGAAASVTLGEFSTDGPIVDGPAIPGIGDGDIDAEELSGVYFDPSRDGEGCQLTLERDAVTFILTCYLYSGGEQLWLIGVGVLLNDEVIFSDLTITSGADYGDDFDAADVVRTFWGTGMMTWSDCNNATLELLPLIPGFEMWTFNFTKIVPITCGVGGVQGDALPWMGTYFDPARDGEGFMLSVEGDGTIFVMTWYTYLNGKQVWLIGVGVRTGNRLVFEHMEITTGASYGSEFDPADVIRQRFGSITVDFSDCNNFMAAVDTDLAEFHDIVLNVTKIVPGSCP